MHLFTVGQPPGVHIQHDHFRYPKSRVPSLFLIRSYRCFCPSRTPSCLFIALSPVVFHIPQRPFDLVHRLRVSGVLPNIVADFDCRSTVCGRDLDNNVQWSRFSAVG